MKNLIIGIVIIGAAYMFLNKKSENSKCAMIANALSADVYPNLSGSDQLAMAYWNNDTSSNLTMCRGNPNCEVSSSEKKLAKCIIKKLGNNCDKNKKNACQSSAQLLFNMGQVKQSIPHNKNLLKLSSIEKGEEAVRLITWAGSAIGKTYRSCISKKEALSWLKCNNISSSDFNGVDSLLEKIENRCNAGEIDICYAYAYSLARFARFNDAITFHAKVASSNSKYKKKSKNEIKSLVHKRVPSR